MIGIEKRMCYRQIVAVGKCRRSLCRIVKYSRSEDPRLNICHLKKIPKQTRTVAGL